MEKILVIGNAGAGKTTFSKKLSAKLGLPLIHLDRLYWRGQWEYLSRTEFEEALQVELEKPQWILDGNFTRTLPHRLSYCDTVFYFDFPTIYCLWGITKRVFQHYGKTREDMGGNCVERFDRQKAELYSHVLTFNKTHRKDYYQLFSQHPEINLIIFKNRRQVRKYLQR